MEGTVAVIHLTLHERGQERIVAQRVDTPVPPIMEEIVAGANLTPHERKQERIAVQKFDILKERIASEQRGNRESAPARGQAVRV